MEFSIFAACFLNWIQSSHLPGFCITPCDPVFHLFVSVSRDKVCRVAILWKILRWSSPQSRNHYPHYQDHRDHLNYSHCHYP